MGVSDVLRRPSVYTVRTSLLRLQYSIAVHFKKFYRSFRMNPSFLPCQPTLANVLLSTMYTAFGVSVAHNFQNYDPLFVFPPTLEWFLSPDLV